MNENIKDIIPKIISGNSSPKESKIFNEEIKNCPECFEEYRELMAVWNKTEKEEPEDLPDIDAQWNRLAERITEYSDVKNEGAAFAKFTTSFWEILLGPKMKPVYAGLLVVIIMTSILLLFNTEQIDKDNTVSYSTNNAERLDVLLPDGSSVKLNNGSKIQYDENTFSEFRKIALEGEAFFIVKKDDGPFAVVTQNAITKVMGTEFNVWSRKDETRVIVREGVVNLSPNIPQSKGITLSHDESSVIIKDAPPEDVQTVNSKLLLGWLDGKLVFNKTSLSEVVEETERFYNVSIDIRNPEIESRTMTGTFSTSTVDSVLVMISLALDCEYEKELDTYILK